MKNHWITNCPHFKDGDKTAELKSEVDCEICLDKLYDALEEGLVENRIVMQPARSAPSTARRHQRALAPRTPQAAT